MDGIRPGGNLVFDRLRDGSVVLARLQSGGRRVAGDPNRDIVRFSYIMSPKDWAEVVAYVSVLGPTKEREAEALSFHQRGLGPI